MMASLLAEAALIHDALKRVRQTTTSPPGSDAGFCARHSSSTWLWTPRCPSVQKCTPEWAGPAEGRVTAHATGLRGRHCFAFCFLLWSSQELKQKAKSKKQKCSRRAPPLARPA